MKKILNKYLLLLFLISSLAIPSLTFAQEKIFKLDYSGLVKCDGVLQTDGTEPDRQKVCDFNYLMYTVKSTINWLFVLVTSIAVVACAYGGLMYITGVEKNINKAKDIFYSVGKGFIIMLVAWFAVITVVNWFATSETQKIIKTFVDTGK